MAKIQFLSVTTPIISKRETFSISSDIKGRMQLPMMSCWDITIFPLQKQPSSQPFSSGKYMAPPWSSSLIEVGSRSEDLSFVHEPWRGWNCLRAILINVQAFQSYSVTWKTVKGPKYLLLS
jgi:hypothetical protein